MSNIAWVLRNARVDDGAPLVDIAFEGERITAMGAELPLTGNQEWDLKGSVVLPGFVDAHVHLDTTFLSVQNKSGTLQEAIEVWHQGRPFLTYESYLSRAWRALRMALAHGTTTMRTHVEVDTEGSLVALEALIELREQARGMVDLQIVAFGRPGTSPEEDELMRSALKMGADLVGGAPALTADPERCIDTALDLAESFGKPVDLHVDETDDPNILSLEYLAEQTVERGLQGQVSAGPCSSLAFVDDEVAARVINKVAEAQLNIVLLPATGLVLIGRNRTPAPRGVTRINELLEHGINVAAASDNVRDPFNPFGRYDLLQIANLNAQVAYLSDDRGQQISLEMVTTRAAEVLNLPSYGLFEGAFADLVVLRTRRLAEAVVGVPERLATFKCGRLQVRSEYRRDWLEKTSIWS
ncbi:MAG: amidohydrolase family protein [Trueperaceae bacterium]|nr:MAG: amidohydrolase family protein [Trueperaceae bacterium]